MDSNVKAYKLGRIAREAGNPKRKDVGDNIDRGLILERLLNEAGFNVVVTQQDDTPDNKNPALLKVCGNCGAIHRLISEAETCCE